MVFQLAATGPDAPSVLNWMAELGPWNYAIAFAFMISWVVAHDAVAVGAVAAVMRWFAVADVAGPATTGGTDHTGVIHPHC